MTGDRMRRVDEAMREVLSGAITSEIKDPRVGFVTVTAVETSPDLRHARVFVSVLGDDTVRRRSMAGLRVRARLPAAARRVRAAPQEHADAALPLRRLDRPRDADRRAGRARRARRRELRERRRLLADAAARRAARRGQVPADHPRAPRRRRGRLAGGDAAGADRARQGRARVRGRRRVPAALRVPLHPARGARHRAARRPLRARAGVPGLRQHRPHAGRRPQARGPPDPQHRPPPRQHALRHGQPRRPGRLVHGGDGVGPDAGARRGADAGRSPRRCTSAWSPTRAASCTRTRARGRTRWPPRCSSRASTRTRSTGGCTRGSRRASSSCWRAG